MVILFVQCIVIWAQYRLKKVAAMHSEPLPAVEKMLRDIEYVKGVLKNLTITKSKDRYAL